MTFEVTSLSSAEIPVQSLPLTSPPLNSVLCLTNPSVSGESEKESIELKVPLFFLIACTQI